MQKIINIFKLFLSLIYNLMLLYKSKKSLNKIQLKKLKKLCYHAYNHVPFYQELWIKNNFHPKQLESLDDIKKIPIITKKDIQNNFPTRLLANTHKASDCLLISTTGSSGSLIKIFVDKNKLSHEYSYLTNLYLSKFNNTNINKIAIIVDVHEETLEGQGNEFLPGSNSVYNQIHIFEPIETIVEKIIQNKYSEVFTFPSCITQICQYCMNKSLKIQHKTNYIILTGESVTQKVRDLVKIVFDCRCMEVYACTEVGVIAIETEEGLTSIPCKTILQVLDEKNEPVKLSETGTIVITDLTNYATPIIRYNGLADKATLKSYQSKLTGMAVLEKIVGRVSDVIKLKSGKEINPFILIHYIDCTPGIARFQIIQEKIDLFTIKIIPIVENEENNLKILESFSIGGKKHNNLIQNFREVLGEDNEINIKIVSHISNKEDSHKCPLIIAYKPPTNNTSL